MDDATRRAAGWSTARLHQTTFVGRDDGVRAVAHPEVGEEPADARLAEVQLGGDVAVGASTADQPKNPDLTLGQGAQRLGAVDRQRAAACSDIKDPPWLLSRHVGPERLPRSAAGTDDGRGHEPGVIASQSTITCVIPDTRPRRRRGAAAAAGGASDPPPPRRLTAGRRAVITAIRRPSSRVREVRLVGNREIKAWESARGGRLTGCAPADGTGIQISRTADPVEAACELTEAQAVLELRLSTNETAPTNGAHS